MQNMDIYNAYSNVPAAAQKPIAAGRLKGMTDINPMWRIKSLTECFGPCGIGWYYKATRKWVEQAGNEAIAFVDIELYIKVDGEWSMPIIGTGGSMMLTQESKGLHASDECYKMATTDAISVACKQLGFGADVYWNAGRTKYSGSETNSATKNTTDSKVNAADITQIKAMCKQKGLDVNVVFNTPLESLTKEQFLKALEQLRKLKDKK